MEMIPPSPEIIPEPAIVVLGRFQPLHKGHTFLLRKGIEFRDEHHPSKTFRIMVGSSNVEQSPDNPWTWEERVELIQTWLKSEQVNNFEVLAVPDLGDPENWVRHAENWHGKSGILVSSNDVTTTLYEESGWQVHTVSLTERDTFEGWRVRQNLLMLSTLDNADALKEVMSVTLESIIIDWLLEDDFRIRRLAFIGPKVEHVG